jgi:drug/metabolite transporter (DMT)-like permease
MLIVGRYVGVALIVFGLLCGAAILYGSYEGHFQAGLLRTWTAFGASYLVGLLLASLCSGLSSSDRLVRRAGGAVLGLGVLAGAVLALNSADVLVLKDTMQPWALLAACAVVGGVILFGSSS